MCKEADAENSLLTGSLWKQMLVFGFPLLLGNLFQQLYGSVDSVIVGRCIGPLALAAVGSTGSLVFLLVSFFQGIATGASVLIAQACGAGQTQRARDGIATSLALSVISGLALTAFFFLLTPSMVRWMLTPADIFEMTRDYLRVYMFSLPAVAVYNTGTAILRAMGDSRRPLYFLVFSSAVNVALDLLLVRVIPLGVMGAALATVFSQTVSAVLVVRVITRLDGGYAVHLREIRVHGAIARQVAALGLPAAVQNSAVSFANVLFQSQINLFGSIAVAGYSAGARINNFLYMPISAFGLAATTFVGQNAGAGNYRRVKECGRVCLLLSVGITLVFSVLTFLLRYPLLRIFSGDSQVLAYGSLMLAVIGLPTFLWAFPLVYGSVLTGLGRSFSSMAITMANMCGIRLLWIFGMLRVWDHILVVYLSYPVTWITAGASMLVYYRKVAKTFPPAECPQRKDPTRAAAS